jgi:hypothetical protein
VSAYLQTAFKCGELLLHDVYVDVVQVAEDFGVAGAFGWGVVAPAVV